MKRTQLAALTNSPTPSPFLSMHVYTFTSIDA